MLYNLLLDCCLVNRQYLLDYDYLVLVSPYINQDIYQIIINGFRANLARRHVRMLIEVQDKVIQVYSAIKLNGRLVS